MELLDIVRRLRMNRSIRAIKRESGKHRKVIRWVRKELQAPTLSRRTLRRWRQWWLEVLPRSSFWSSARTRLMPPVDEQSLPASRLVSLSGEVGAPMTLRTVSRVGLRSPRKRLVETFSGQPGIARNLRHALGTGDIAQGLGDERRIAVGLLQARFQICGHLLRRAEVLGDIIG